MRLEIFPVSGMPEIRPGMDLTSEMLRALARAGERLCDGDVVAVAQKVVSKAEGRIRYLPEVEPGPTAVRLANEHGKDPRVVETILQGSRRVVRAIEGVIITETHHGFICADSGVDRSNAGAADTVVLLPQDADASARKIRLDIRERCGVSVGVVITDTFGRAWREGQTNAAIGFAGVPAFVTYAGQRDPNDYELRVTQIALADELAAASELVMGKLERRPVAIIRGLAHGNGDDGATDYVRAPERDLFR